MSDAKQIKPWHNPDQYVLTNADGEEIAELRIVPERGGFVIHALEHRKGVVMRSLQSGQVWINIE